MKLQHTLRKDLVFSGLGVHSGAFVKIRLKPALVNVGIVFIHDLFPTEPMIVGATIPLQAMHATVLRQQSWTLSTVEHLIAAIRMANIDNVIIEVSGEEIPILDGSAAPFFHEICRTGLVTQGQAKQYLMPRMPLYFEEGVGKKIILKPLPEGQKVGTLDCVYEGVFNHYALGIKKITGRIDQEYFKRNIAPARTFGFLEQLPYLRNHKLAMASSLGNTLVFNAEEMVNDNRIVDEWLNHKILDFIGDLGLLPYAFTGQIEASQTGHAFNRRVVEHYLACPGDWVVVS